MIGETLTWKYYLRQDFILLTFPWPITSHVSHIGRKKHFVTRSLKCRGAPCQKLRDCIRLFDSRIQAVSYSSHFSAGNEEGRLSRQSDDVGSPSTRGVEVSEHQKANKKKLYEDSV